MELKLRWLFPHSRSLSSAPSGVPSGASNGAFSFCGAAKLSADLSVFVMGLGLEFVFVVSVTQINAVMKCDL